MDESFLQYRKRQRNLIFVFLVIITAGFFVFIWQRFMTEPLPPSPEIERLPVIKINFEVLQSPLLQEFQLFEEIPPLEGEIGRENPFLSY